MCEKQEEHFCGRHALRALTQRCDLFSDEYLIGIAQNLAADEQTYRRRRKKLITEYCYEKTGDYHIQILEIALRNMFNVDLIQISKLEENSCPIRNLICANIQHIQAILIQQDYHYYCLRRFRLTKEYFFKIDSKHSMYHEPIHCRNMLTFLRTLLELHSNVYVIIQHIPNGINEQVSVNNIETKLWTLPDSSADCEVLIKGTHLQ